MLGENDRVFVDGEPVRVGTEIASRFRPGDRLFGVEGGRILHVPSETDVRVRDAVDRAARAFDDLQSRDQDQVTLFFDLLASALLDEKVVACLRSANASDLARARSKGRSTTRLELTDTMLAAMVDALRLWRDSVERPNEVERTVAHEGWRVDVVRAPLGVVAFVFEGRPNVFSDATGVLRMGNTCVFRIGSDALDTAREIMNRAVLPNLARAGLPEDAVVLVDDESHAAAWSLFSQRKVSLAVARGSGAAVRDLGAVARQSGIAVSLHGAGGAWMIVSDDVDDDTLESVVRHSLDRKVCNTLNVVCLVGSDVRARLDRVVHGIESAARVRRSSAVIHDITRLCVATDANTTVLESQMKDLSIEWEWEERPEVSVVAVSTMDEALTLFNEFSPRFVLSVLSRRESDSEHVWSKSKAPFVGNGMTRWVDGQFALRRPELGLANWEGGPLLGRGAILSGGDVFTIRYRVTQDDPTLHR
jgi:glutamate-5-semialdehyde dehydrogenase